MQDFPHFAGGGAPVAPSSLQPKTAETAPPSTFHSFRASLPPAPQPPFHIPRGFRRSGPQGGHTTLPNPAQA